MKVMIVCVKLCGGGAERVAAVLASGLAERGHDVTITYIKRGNEYEVSPKVRHYILNSFLPDTNNGPFVTKVWHKILKRVAWFKIIKNALKDNEPDVVVSIMRYFSIPLLWYCHGRVPLIFSEHTNFNDKVKSNLHQSWQRPIAKIKSWIYRFDRNHLIKYADAVTLLTNYDNVFVGERLKNKVVLPNPLTFPPICNEEYESLFPKRKNILSCGRVTDWRIKGFDNLIRSFSLIAGSYPDWDLDIAGASDNVSLNYLKELTKELGVEDRIHFLGYRKDIVDLMKSHSIYVLSSRHEGLPMSLTEAMANGMACVAFDCISGPNEIILDSIDGVLAENQDNEKLAGKISLLIENEGLRYEIGHNAIVNIKRFSVDRIVRMWEELFNKTSKKYQK